MGKEIFLVASDDGYNTWTLTECDTEAEACDVVQRSYGAKTKIYKATPLKLTFKEVET